MIAIIKTKFHKMKVIWNNEQMFIKIIDIRVQNITVSMDLR